MSSEEKRSDENNEVQTPAPKKRGRKRKSEISLRNIEEIPPEVIPEETVSRSGRRRKKVNYYELANPDNLEIPVQLDQELSYVDNENEEVKVKRRKTEKIFTAETSDTSKEEDNQTTENSLPNGNHESIISNGEESVSNLESINSLPAQDVNVTLEDATTSREATTSTPTFTPNNKDKRYNYTGETVKMMNTLFNLFSDEKVTQDGTNKISNNDSTLTNSTNGKRSYKKAKKHEAESDDLSANVTCAVCNTSLDKSLWSHHKQRYHNNLAWRIGDPPLDLNDQSFVMHTLNLLYKKKKPLYCDKCGAVKKSVVGFLSHRSTCLKSEEQLESVKIACELCGRKMLPVSMTTHMKTLHLNNAEKVKDVSEMSEIETNKPLPSKRSAAKKAMKIIENVTKTDSKETNFSTNLDLGSQEFARVLMQKELDDTQFIECKFRCNCITTSMEDALRHFEECTEKPPEGFVCKKCLAVSTKLEEIVYHIEITHEITLEKDEDEDEDPSFVDKESGKLPSYLRSVIRKSERVLFPYASQWTYKFCKENFSEHLFTDLFNKSNWLLLLPNEAVQYLPKMNESCHVARITVTSFINPLKSDYDLKKFNLFESEVHDNQITLFCGGPVSALSWLPTPFSQEDQDQILAVSVLNSPDQKCLTYENIRECSAIQFWNFGPLQNKKFSLEEPKLVFSLAHDHGPVWHMEFCPSGCYDKERKGLLAVAGSDEVVCIYSVPAFHQEEKGLYYKPKPVMKLLLQRHKSPLLGGLKYYPSKISWSKASGHQYISVGYTNGFIALFNIKSTSLILKFKDSEGIPCVLPNKCFQAHSHAITALSLYHMNGGCRWLLSGSTDRRLSFWDLDNHNYPICDMKKNIVTDGFWFTNWLCYVSTCDEGSTINHVTTMLKQIRDYMFDPNVTLTCSLATISSVSGSDWLNGIIHANTVGEVVALFPHQILQFPEHQKILKTKRLLFGYTYLLDKQKTPEERVSDDAKKRKTLENLSSKKMTVGVKLSKIKANADYDSVFVNEPVLYEEAEQKYALLFCDNKMESYVDFPKSTAKQLTALSKSYGIMHPNQYPLSTINKIVFNPNRQASLYFATGYQAGFVRISWMEFLKSDNQIK